MCTFLLEQKLFLGPMLGPILSGTGVGDKLYFLPLFKLWILEACTVLFLFLPQTTQMI